MPLLDNFFFAYNQVELVFEGNGFMEFNKKLISYKKDTEMTLTIKFSTVEPNGLLLWQGGQTQVFALAGEKFVFHFILLWSQLSSLINCIVNDGKVEARLNGLLLSSPVRVDDGNIHEVTLTRKGLSDLMTLVVDSSSPAMSVVQNLDGDVLATKDVFLGEWAISRLQRLWRFLSNYESIAYKLLLHK